MAEIILLTLWICTALFFVCREIKAKGDRERREWWTSELSECLHSIENEFSRRCYELTEKAFSRHNYPSYREQVNELKKEYLNDLYGKVVERKGKYFLTTFPDYMAKEYERNISELADIYLNLSKLH